MGPVVDRDLPGFQQIHPRPKVMPARKDLIKIHPRLISIIAKTILISNVCIICPMKRGVSLRKNENNYTVGIVCISRKLNNPKINADIQTYRDIVTDFERYTHLLYYYIVQTRLQLVTP